MVCIVGVHGVWKFFEPSIMVLLRLVCVSNLFTMVVFSRVTRGEVVRACIVFNISRVVPLVLACVAVLVIRHKYYWPWSVVRYCNTVFSPFLVCILGIIHFFNTLVKYFRK